MKIFTKGLFGLLILMNASFIGFTQNVGISANGSQPNTSAGLDVDFTDKGLLIPRLALTGTSNVAPLAAHVAGMLVYNTATAGDVTPGFYYNNGTLWNRINVNADWNASSGVTQILNKPTIDGSETKVSAGTNITITGEGTVASPYVINATAASATTHSIGEVYGGGRIFFVTPDGTHGLIAANQDQCNSSWYQATNNLSYPPYYDAEGQKYTDWRLPTLSEIILLYNQRALFSGFVSGGYYWSSSEFDYQTAYWKRFDAGGQQAGGAKTAITNRIRAVRSF